jgi:hypothetical protein
MKDKFRIIESDKFYIQEKTSFGWRYIYDDEYVEGLQAFLAVAGLVGLLGIIINLIIVIVYWIKGTLEPNFNSLLISSLSFVGFTIFSFVSVYIIKHIQKISKTCFADAKEHVESLIKQYEIMERQLEKKKEDKEKRKHMKVHYLDIKIERREKLKKIK